MSWSPPEQFEEYRIVRQLGAGAMGQVYLAHDTLLDRAVAIKFVGGQEIAIAMRERFFIEARAVARLTHPNVVGIHRVGEIRNRPYLVSEYIRGTTVAEVERPLPWERTLALAIGLARGLGAAHRRGVLHRDLKPANAIVDETGEVKLLDFGLAKLAGAPDETLQPPIPRARGGRRSERALDATISIAPRTVPSAHAKGTPSDAMTVTGALIGTPLYMAPELLRGEVASTSSDVYALGITLYELLAGAAPNAALSIAELREVTERITPIASVVPEVPTKLAAIVDACIHRDPAARPQTGDDVLARLETVLAKAEPSVQIVGNPYRGLGRFEADHRELFFGRDHETREVAARLRTEAFVLVAGDSGAGKSSLGRAGVLPVLADTSFAGRTWRTAVITPGKRPLVAIDRVIATAAAEHPGDGLILFIDQFEELVTIADPADAAGAAERIAELGLLGQIRVLASARSDFLGRLAALPGIGSTIGRGLYLLGPLGERDLREAIVGPTHAVGYTWESESTIAELVASGRSSLPLLQFTLAELWDARDEGRRRIPSDAVATIGGVAGALARRADQVMASLDEHDRAIAWRIFVRLTTADGTRALASRSELTSLGDHVGIDRIVEVLVAARLLVLVGGSDGDHVEVVHEALLSSWPRLVEWRHTHTEDARLRDQYAEGARRWHERGRPNGLLWRGDALAEYRAWRRRWAEPATELESDFAAANLAEARRARLTRLALVAGSLAALTVGIVILYGQRETAVAERREADLQRRTLLVEQASVELDNGHDARALPYLVEAIRAGDRSAGVRVLAGRAVATISREIWSRRFTSNVGAVRWAPDGQRFAVDTQDGLLLLDASGRELGSFASKRSGAALAFTADGSLLLEYVHDGKTLRLFDGSNGSLVKAIELPTARDEQPMITGGKIAVGGSDGVVRLLRATDLEIVAAVPGDEPALGASVSPDGRFLAGGFASEVIVWDVASGARILEIPVATSTFAAAGQLRFSPDSQRLAFSGRHPQIWNVTTRTRIAQLTAEHAGIAVDPAGERLVTSTRSITSAWDFATGELLTTFAGHGATMRLEFSADGRFVTARSVERSFRVWDMADGSHVATYEIPVLSAAGVAEAGFVSISPDGTRLVASTANTLTMFAFDLAPLRGRILDAQAASAMSARPSPDETRVLVARYQGILELFDRATSRSLVQVAVGKEPLWDASWSPDGTRIVVAGAIGARVYDAELEVVRDLDRPTPDADTAGAQYSPDGRQILVEWESAVWIYDAATFTLVRTLPHPGKTIMAAAWSRDGTRIATGTWNRELRVWDAARGEILDEWSDPLLKYLDVAFSHDGTRLAAASHSGSVQIWDLANRARPVVLTGHLGPVPTVAWSPDDRLVATGSSDTDVRIWDPVTARSVARWRTSGENLRVVWDRAGSTVTSAGGSSGVWWWAVAREQRSVAALEDFVRARVPWRLVEGQLEVRDAAAAPVTAPAMR